MSSNQDDVIRAKDSRIRKLRVKNEDLKSKLEKLQKASKNVQFLVPYDLNTLVERDMAKNMPNVIYRSVWSRFHVISRGRFFSFCVLHDVPF